MPIVTKARKTVRVKRCKAKQTWGTKVHVCALPEGHKGMHQCGVGVCQMSFGKVA